jgi:hypothetical protein
MARFEVAAGKVPNNYVQTFDVTFEQSPAAAA